MSAATWADLGIEQPPPGRRDYRTHCPKCEGRRKTLGVDTDRGLFNCFRCGFSGRLGGSERCVADHLDQIEKASRAREVAQTRAANWASRLWRNAGCCLWHEYLRRKAILRLGVRLHGDRLVVPMYDAEGQLWNVQTITNDGDKRFLKGGGTSGLYFPIQGRSEEIIICEGFASGVTLHRYFYPHARPDAPVASYNANTFWNIYPGLENKR